MIGKFFRKIMDKIELVICNICTAFEEKTVGSKVIKLPFFMAALKEALKNYDTTKDRVLGQHFLVLPKQTNEYVRCGVGKHTHKLEDYGLSEHRGRIGVFLKANHAAPTQSVSAVVYTLEAYAKDPDVNLEELKSFQDCGATHVIVAILASAENTSPYPVWTFVRNLAGANHEAQLWSADEIRTKAQAIATYWETWSTVADC